ALQLGLLDIELERLVRAVRGGVRGRAFLDPSELLRFGSDAAAVDLADRLPTDRGLTRRLLDLRRRGRLLLLLTFGGGFALFARLTLIGRLGLGFFASTSGRGRRGVRVGGRFAAATTGTENQGCGQN